MSKGPCSQKETWWWNEEVAEAVREKKKKYNKRKSDEKGITDKAYVLPGVCLSDRLSKANIVSIRHNSSSHN